MSEYFYHGCKILTPYSITSNRNTFEVETLSLKRFTFLTEAQRWELSFNVMSNGPNEAALLAAHTFDFHSEKTMIMPQLPSVNAVFAYSGTLTLTSNAAAGADSLTLTSTGQVGPGNIPAGTFITFEGHSKVYVVKAAVTPTDAATNIALSIYPKLVAPVLATKQVKLGSACLLTYKLDMTAGRGLSFADGIFVSPGTIKLIEAL